MTTLPVTLVVNGETVTALAEPRLHLADLLRDQLRLTATHLGCEHGVCGACTVLLDGVPARACITLAVSVEGAAVTTLEGLADDRVMAVLKAAFHEHHGLQCGFCTPGMLIAARDVLQRAPGIDEHALRVAMSGNLCRCTGYQGIIRSILAARDTLAVEAAA
jgi:carbon-monoxide dehydrogenase small subunit